MDKYDEFLAGYEKLCLETGYYFDVTQGGELGTFYIDDDFTAQIKELKGEVGDDD